MLFSAPSNSFFFWDIESRVMGLQKVSSCSCTLLSELSAFLGGTQLCPKCPFRPHALTATLALAQSEKCNPSQPPWGCPKPPPCSGWHRLRGRLTDLIHFEAWLLGPLIFTYLLKCTKGSKIYRTKWGVSLMFAFQGKHRLLNLPLNSGFSGAMTMMDYYRVMGLYISCRELHLTFPADLEQVEQYFPGL